MDEHPEGSNKDTNLIEAERQETKPRGDLVGEWDLISAITKNFDFIS